MAESHSVTNRRTFLRRTVAHCAGTCAYVTLSRPLGWGPNPSSPACERVRDEPARAQEPLRIALVTALSPSPHQLRALEGQPGDQSAARSGVELGIEEAARAATLLGRSVRLVATVEGLDEAGALLREERIDALICAASAEAIEALAGPSVSKSTMLVNTAATSDALRNDRCAKTVFHVAASDAMLTDARHVWNQGEASRAGAATIELWHSTLERYGAGQLNARFESRFRRPMESLAWAGWFAVKVVWEASQRVGSVNGTALIAHLQRDATRFDGHKGVALSFRPWDHQLRQPLYLVPTSAGTEPRELRAGVATIPAQDTLAANTALDVLGTSRSESTCRW